MNAYTDRFWAKVEKSDAGCWYWTGAVQSGGYGSAWNGERMASAHRWAYEMLVGPIPEGLVLDHLCRVRLCVNPAHLEPVTNAENIRRGDIGGRAHCTAGHEYTPENTYYRKDRPGERDCRRCRKERARQSYLRGRAA